MVQKLMRLDCMQNLSISCALVCLIVLGSAALVGAFGVCKHQISAVLVTGVIGQNTVDSSRPLDRTRGVNVRSMILPEEKKDVGARKQLALMSTNHKN
ncbi:hypothetical protein MSG28_004230 [Choristoneura fumiferana]|uniref:Uncharacterized protein n=1 Tax=Choristoneura fumiferana TaxID=7141 RepID=A0ACC0KIP7_CHOFU|nr:hypothetical protein MSG28_004230 [Choristoneura fumiferana]